MLYVKQFPLLCISYVLPILFINAEVSLFISTEILLLYVVLSVTTSWQLLNLTTTYKTTAISAWFVS
jgi:hypothetical protein